MKSATGADTAAASTGTIQDTAAKSAMSATLPAMVATDKTFAYLGMARCVTQARKGGPSHRWSNSHCRKRGEEMEKAQNAIRMKIVVGNNGTNRPRRPMLTISQPNAIAVYRRAGDLRRRWSLRGCVTAGTFVTVIRYCPRSVKTVLTR